MRFLMVPISLVVLASTPTQASAQSRSYSGTVEPGEVLQIGFPSVYDFTAGVWYVSWQFDHPVTAQAEIFGNYETYGPTWGLEIHSTAFGSQPIGETGHFYLTPQRYYYDYFGDRLLYAEEMTYFDVTFSGGLPAKYDFNVYFSPSVPEPAAWGMMIGGFGLAGAAMRRRLVKIAYA